MQVQITFNIELFPAEIEYTVLCGPYVGPLKFSRTNQNLLTGELNYQGVGSQILTHLKLERVNGTPYIEFNNGPSLYRAIFSEDLKTISGSAFYNNIWHPFTGVRK